MTTVFPREIIGELSPAMFAGPTAEVPRSATPAGVLAREAVSPDEGQLVISRDNNAGITHDMA